MLAGTLLCFLVVMQMAFPQGWPLGEAELQAAGSGVGEDRQRLLVTRSHRPDSVPWASEPHMDRSLLTLTYLCLLIA